MFEIEFTQVDKNRKFTFDNVEHITCFETFIMLQGYDILFNEKKPFTITVHRAEYDYFTVHKQEDRDND